MRFFISTLLFLLPFTFFTQKKQPHSGRWKAFVSVNDRLEIPFWLQVQSAKGHPDLSIQNGNEIITLKVQKWGKDSLRATFPDVDAELIFAFENNQSMRGYWRNLSAKVLQNVPFYAYPAENETRCKPEGTIENVDFNGKWKTVFAPNTPQASNAIGLFKVNQQVITGTFLTESGDYRFLEGNVAGNQWQMSSFNGSWAFFVDAHFNADTLRGIFYSGAKGKTEFVAVRDAQFELGNPNDLTKVVNEQDFQFQDFITLKNKRFNFPGKKYKGKVVILQIMGTWCPNCMDETRLLKEMYETYRKDGLEIVALGYERGEQRKTQLTRLKDFKRRLNVPYEVVLSGTANKDVASKHFPMLSGISSFPTTVFLDRNGKIVAVHTGFNGPATGESYQQWVKGTKELIEQYLLK
jgi:thiol-disulfide isomerase/thioredoxin